MGISGRHCISSFGVSSDFHVNLYHFVYLIIGDIGGQLGLFLGASFITLAEIISYIVHKVKRCFATIRESESPATEPDNSKIEGVTNSAF